MPESILPSEFGPEPKTAPPSEPGSASRSTVRTIVVLVITTVLVLAGVWLVQAPWKSDDTGPGSQNTDGSGVTSIDVGDSGKPAPAVGQLAADFTATTITGETIQLSDLRGKPVWLVFGATWCTNCRAEAPDVQSVSAALDGTAHVVSVYVGEPTSTVSSYAERLRLTYPQIADTTESLSSTYAVMGIPAHFFIDKDGRIAQIRVGTLTQQTATDILDSLA